MNTRFLAITLTLIACEQVNAANPFLDAAVRKVSTMEKAPDFEPGDIYGIVSGKFTHTNAPWETTIELKGDQCVYLSSHTSSGHFKKVVGKKGLV